MRLLTSLREERKYVLYFQLVIAVKINFNCFDRKKVFFRFHFLGEYGMPSYDKSAALYDLKVCLHIIAAGSVWSEWKIGVDFWVHGWSKRNRRGMIVFGCWKQTISLRKLSHLNRKWVSFKFFYFEWSEFEKYRANGIFRQRPLRIFMKILIFGPLSPGKTL